MGNGFRDQDLSSRCAHLLLAFLCSQPAVLRNTCTYILIHTQMPRVLLHTNLNMHILTCVHTYIHVLETSSYQYLQFQSIPTESFLPSPIPYLCVSSSTMRMLALKINTFTHLLSHIIYLKEFHHFAHTTTMNRSTKWSSGFVCNPSLYNKINGI